MASRTMAPPNLRPAPGPALDGDDSDSDDVDLTLRHVTHRFPDELARALLPGATSLTDCAWRDTQLTARERRLDKSLYVVADGVARVEHVEWQMRWTRQLLHRMYEYHALTTLALHDEARGGERVPRVQSTVVLLGGRRATPWPAHMRYRTTPATEPFSGLRVRVEAVYQRTLAELAARASPLWMIFAPLAIDASRENLPAVVRALKQRTPRARFEELAVAMTALADADSRGRGLGETIQAQLPEELVMHSRIYTQGLEKGLEKGTEQGLRMAIAQVVKARGLRLTATRRATLEAENRPAVLQAWLTRAATAERVADVFVDPR